MNSDNIWALRGVASRMGQVGHLAVVALCDDLLAARKERDAAESALENIRSARNANADAAMVLVRVREAAGARSGTDIVEAVRGLRTLADSAAGHAEVMAAMLGYIGDVRRAAGLRVGEGLVRFVGEMRKRLEANEALERVGDDIMAEVRNAAGAKLGDDIVEIVKELRRESEGLYRFKVRIREALGVEKGVDMADAVRKLKAAPGAEHIRKQASAWIVVFAALRPYMGKDWKGSGCQCALRAIRELAFKSDLANRHDDAMMRQNLAEKTAECEKLQARVRVLESTIREHEKDLKVIEELQDEQTKLNALLMRMAEGEQRTTRSVPVVLDPNMPTNTWGWLICRGKAKA